MPPVRPQVSMGASRLHVARQIEDGSFCPLLPIYSLPFRERKDSQSQRRNKDLYGTRGQARNAKLALDCQKEFISGLVLAVFSFSKG